MGNLLPSTIYFSMISWMFIDWKLLPTIIRSWLSPTPLKQYLRRCSWICAINFTSLRAITKIHQFLQIVKTSTFSWNILRFKKKIPSYLWGVLKWQRWYNRSFCISCYFENSTIFALLAFYKSNIVGNNFLSSSMEVNLGTASFSCKKCLKSTAWLPKPFLNLRNIM